MEGRNGGRWKQWKRMQEQEQKPRRRPRRRERMRGEKREIEGGRRREKMEGYYGEETEENVKIKNGQRERIYNIYK